MHWLSMDTATETCSVAILKEYQAIVDIRLQLGRTHARQLSGTLAAALEMASIVPSDIDAVAVGIGPGSFTGLRIGMSTAKGIALALGVPLYGISTLDALAVQIQDPGRLICPMIDARRGQVYWAGYRYGSDGLAQVLPIRADFPKDAAAAICEASLLVGSGAMKYKDCFDELNGPSVCYAADDLNTVRAAAIGTLAVRRFSDAPTGADHDPVPLYVRQSDAQLSRRRESSPTTTDAIPNSNRDSEKASTMD